MDLACSENKREGGTGSSIPLFLVGPRVSFFVSWLGGMFWRVIDAFLTDSDAVRFASMKEKGSGSLERRLNPNLVSGQRRGQYLVSA